MLEQHLNLRTSHLFIHFFIFAGKDLCNEVNLVLRADEQNHMLSREDGLTLVGSI